jgi:hypothetical protein
LLQGVLLPLQLNLEFKDSSSLNNLLLHHFSFESLQEMKDIVFKCNNDSAEGILGKVNWVEIDKKIIHEWIKDLKENATEIAWAHQLFYEGYKYQFERAQMESIPFIDEQYKNAIREKRFNTSDLHKLCCKMFSVNFFAENYLYLINVPFKDKVEGFARVLENFLSEGSKFKFDLASYGLGSPLRTNDPLNDFFRDGLYDYFQTLRMFFCYEFKHLDNNRSNPKRFYSPEDMDEVSRNITGKLLSFDKDKIVEILRDILGIADDFEVVDIEGYLKKLMIIKNGKRTNIVDMGYGITQLLPIFLKPDEEKGDLFAYPKSWLVSEPETGLHPSLQSKLADLFAHLHAKSGSRFVIETHSEYIIRKLQYLIRQTSCPLTKDDVQIYYFYHPDEIPPGENQIKPINIDEDGNLTDNFGPGFYDESSRISLELWSLNTSQKN